MNLQVIHEFGQYKKGDIISDKAEVEALLDSEYAPCVQKIASQPEAKKK